MALYTGTISYGGNDRLDITVKGQHEFGKLFAPTWEMIKRYRETGDWQEYLRDYYAILDANPEAVKRLCKMAIIWDVTLVCYCPKVNYPHCHRWALAQYMVDNCPIVMYGGER